jgi:hypothetical protein
MQQENVWQAPGIPNNECVEQEQGNEEKLGPGDHPQDVPSSSGFALHTAENEEMSITSTKLTSLHSLQRLLMIQGNRCRSWPSTVCE